MGDTAKFVGTYALITTEQKDKATGKWASAPTFNSNGYIIYSATGQMAVHIQPKIRERMPTPPTGEAALKAHHGVHGVLRHLQGRRERQSSSSISGSARSTRAATWTRSATTIS